MCWSHSVTMVAVMEIVRFEEWGYVLCSCALRITSLMLDTSRCDVSNITSGSGQECTVKRDR